MNKMRLLSVLIFSLVFAVAAPLWAAEGEPSENEAAAAGAEAADAEGAHAAAGHGEGNSNPLSIDPDLAIFTAIVFVLLLGILWLFAWGPISEGLNKREKSISDQIDEAQRSNEKAHAMLKQYEQRLAAAQDEVRAMLADARKSAEATKDGIVAEAKEAAQRERERAVAEIGVAKEAAVRELAQSVVNNAVALTGRMLHREVDSHAHSDLIKEALDKFPSHN